MEQLWAVSLVRSRASHLLRTEPEYRKKSIIRQLSHAVIGGAGYE